MNPCLKCRFAEWKKTAAGRLHPSGAGRCHWKMPEIALPKSRYYIGHERVIPPPTGGYIERNDQQECRAFEEDFP